jgi:hypothetical protein
MHEMSGPHPQPSMPWWVATPGAPCGHLGAHRPPVHTELSRYVKFPPIRPMRPLGTQATFTTKEDAGASVFTLPTSASHHQVQV